MTTVKKEDRERALKSMQFVGRRPAEQDAATQEFIEHGTGTHATPEMRTRAYHFAEAREAGFKAGFHEAAKHHAPNPRGAPETPEESWPEGNPMGKFKV